VNTRLSLAVDEAMGEAVGEGRYPSKQALIEAAVRAELGLDAE
jgi:Arc/MetJ-type ribon-helix-helix transcriptional regulator